MEPIPAKPRSEPASRQRLEDVTLLFGFGMLLVVFGHSYPDFNVTSDPAVRADYWLHDLIYAFHMPLFFFISGFLYFYTSLNRAENYGTFLWKKFRRLLVPYLVISTAAFPLKAMAGTHAMHPVSLSWPDYFSTLIYPWKNTIIFFWFLPSLFLIFCAAPGLRRILLRGPRPWLPLIVLAALVILNLSMPFRSDALANWQGVLHHLVYFYAGMLLCLAHPSGLHLSMRSWQALLGVGLFAACYPFAQTNPGRLVLAFCGIALCIGLIAPRTPLLRQTLLLVGRSSFDIYLLSWFPQTVAKIVLYEKLHLGFWIATLGMFLTGVIVPLLIVKWIVPIVPKFGLVLGHEIREATNHTGNK